MQPFKAQKTILTCSLKEWMEIGEKANWIKIAAEGEEIEIEGKKYREVNGELIEIPTTPVTPKVPQKSYTSKIFKDITLTEGEVSGPRSMGSFLVKSIDPVKNTLEAEFVDGKLKGNTYTYNMEETAKNIVDTRKRTLTESRIQDINLAGTDLYFTLGYLAKEGKIHIQAPSSDAETIKRRYNKASGGDDLMKYYKSAFEITESNKWGAQLRIFFKDPSPAVLEKMKLPEGINILPREGTMEINDSNFVWNLITRGFKPGNNAENIDAIAAKLSGDNKVNFLKGANFIIA